MRAFHNDIKIKDFYINRVKRHAQADEIIKGKYWENGKGCAIGCTIHGNNHKKYEDELGIPEILARLEDRIFENIPNELAKTWPLRFLESIKVGADLSKIWPKFAIFLLTDPTQCNSRHPQCNVVAKSYVDELNGKIIDWVQTRCAAAYNAANAHTDADDAYYAYYAAYASAYTAHTDDAYYAYNAVYASAYTAYASAYTAYAADDAADAAKTNAFVKQSEKLLELLSETE